MESENEQEVMIKDIEWIEEKMIYNAVFSKILYHI